MSVSPKPRRSFGKGAIDADVELKVVMVGSVSVGKTSIVTRYVRDMFKPGASPTIGAAYVWKAEKIQNTAVKLSIWDTAGQEQYNSLVPVYFREASAVLLVVDASRVATFDAVRTTWLPKVRENSPDSVVIYLFLNKTDVPQDEREVSLSDLRRFADDECIVLIGEGSAKRGNGIHEMFLAVGQLCLDRRRNDQGYVGDDLVIAASKRHSSQSIFLGSDKSSRTRQDAAPGKRRCAC